MSGAFGQVIKEDTLDEIFLSGPGEYLVKNTLMQMAAYKNSTGFAFQQLFGKYTPGSNQQRWSDYSRMDWSIRQLPAVSVYEAEPEDKTSSNAWLNGTISIMVFWPPSQRRSDLARVPMAFKGVMQNFFESQFVVDMLDELYWIVRPAKVPGLNEYGKVMTWTPNVEGFVEDQQVPVSLVNVKYRIDLRAWYRWLEFNNRTKLNPINTPLADLTIIGGQYQGVINNDASQVQVTVPDEINVSNP